MKINPNPNTHSQNLPILDMQACIGHFADPTIVLTTKEINLGIVENHKNDHSEIETTQIPLFQTAVSKTTF